MLKAIVANFRSPSYPARAYAAASCEATEAETVESAAGTNAAAAGTTPSSHRLYHKAMHALEHLLLERGHQARRVLAEYAQRLVRTTPSAPASPPRLTLVGRSVGAQSAHTLNEQQQQQKQTRARSDRTDPTAPHRATLYTAFSGAYVAAALARALAAPCRLSKLS
ncbi:hypothetical protein RI367_001597 [Sorochytrium milnesiophthora]